MLVNNDEFDLCSSYTYNVYNYMVLGTRHSEKYKISGFDCPKKHIGKWMTNLPHKPL